MIAGGSVPSASLCASSVSSSAFEVGASALSQLAALTCGMTPRPELHFAFDLPARYAKANYFSWAVISLTALCDAHAQKASIPML